MKNKIYLDYAATTPLDPEVFKAMRPYFFQKFGNPMSPHLFGEEALRGVDEARQVAADFLGAEPREIIFTSGATESNNLAIKGVIKSFFAKKENQEKKPHILTTAFEHHCVLNAIKGLEIENKIEATFIEPDSNGLIDPKKIKEAIKENTILVSIMYVNNEIGTRQPINEIGEIIEKINSKRQSKIIFHTDATQAINYFDCQVKNLKVDLLSMSAHKIYGPKGVGLLYVKKLLPIKHIQDGGDQEYKLRAGTHNVPGIVGLGKALTLVKKNQKNEVKRLTSLRDYLIKTIKKEIIGVKLNGSAVKRSPNNINMSFSGAEGEALLLSLSLEGLAVSTGSACSSGALSSSHVLLSIGLKPEEADSSLRITLGRKTTKRELETLVKKLKEIVNRIRSISGNILGDYYEIHGGQGAKNNLKKK